MPLWEKIVIGFLIACAFAYVCRAVRNWHLREHMSGLRTWSFYRFHGGAALHSPYPMTHGEAIEYCSRNFGAVAFVDEEHGFIFFKPKSGE